MRIPSHCPVCRSSRIKGTPEHGFQCKKCGHTHLVKVKIKEFTTGNEV
jgi:ribosomal protein L37AE/L43A